MSWDDIDLILYEGTSEQVKDLKCPDCSGKIVMRYYPGTQSMKVRCMECGIITQYNGVVEEPSFAQNM